jgi:class 3 adenylate cyclase
MFSDIIYYLLWFQREAAAAVRRDFWIIIPLTGALIIFAAITVIVIAKSKRALSRRGGAANAAPERAKKKPGAAAKTATVLSGRFLSLNHLSENLLPEHTIILLNRYLHIIQYAADKTEGSFYHNIDGTITAAWGLVATTGNAAHDALNAIRAALILRMNLLALNKNLFVTGRQPLKSISGIGTGKITVGAPHKKNGAACIVGGSVLLAAKAREAAEKSGIDIIITAKTWRLVEQYIIAEELEPLRGADGKAIRLFAVINLRVKNKTGQPRPTNLKELQSLIQTGVF